MADTIASLKSEHWIVEIPDYYVCLDVQLECFHFEDVDMRHFLDRLFKRKLVLEYHLQLLLDIGSHYYESGDYDFAIKLMNRALELNREDSQAWHNKGAALGNLGRHEEVVQYGWSCPV